MKRFILSILISLAVLFVYGQKTPVKVVRIENATTAFGSNVSIGDQVYNMATGELWVANTGVIGTATLATASASFKRVNAEGTITGVTSSTTNLLTVANGTTTPALSIVTGTVANGGTALATGAQIYDFVSGQGYLKTETDPNVKAINGIVKSNGTTISAAVAGTDYLTPTGSAAALTGFPILNQSTTGNAATVTTNANMTGDVTSVGNATTIAAKAVTLAKMNDMPTGSLIYRKSALAGVPEVQSLATLKTDLGLTGTNTGDQTLPTLVSLNAVAANTAITGGTNTKITYDAKGLVTSGVAATTADIAASADKNYVTNAQQTVIANTSGINTGDNTPNSLYAGLATNATHTGDVTGSTALTLATVNSNVGTFNNVTINAKGLATAASNVAYLTNETDPTVKAINGIVKSNGTTIAAAVAGDFPTLNQSTTGNAATATNATNFTGALAGDITGTQGATAIGANKVTYAKMQNVAASRLLGNPTAGAAVPSEISVGSGLALSVGGVLTASGSGGTVTSASVTTANGVSGTVANPTTTPAITLTLGAITPTSVAATGALSGTQLTSTVATGTAPLVVTSTTPVANLSIGGNAATATTASTVTTNANLNGDVTSVGNTTTIVANVVSNADLNQVATATIKGRATAGTGNLEDLTATQVRTLLNVADATSVWKTTGNAGTTAGTNFIGTTDDQDVVFKRNGIQAGLLSGALGNTAWGAGSLNPATTGGANNSIGNSSLASNTTGTGNNALGASSLQGNTSGSNNIGIGNLALMWAQNGSNNIALGAMAGVGDGSTAVQKSLLDNNAIFIGYQASRDVVPRGTALTNIAAIGYMAKVSQNNSLILGGTGANAVSVGIGNTAPDASAVLDITSTTKGGLMPRMTTAQKTAIVSPATGLIVYDTDLNQLQVYNGTSWGTAGAGTGTTNYLSKFTGSTTMGNSQIFDDGTNVGIGTTSPSQKLDIAGNIAINGHPMLSTYSWGGDNTNVWMGGSVNTTVSSTGQASQGNYNIGIGINSLAVNTTGKNNIAIGPWSLYSNTTGGFNTSVGLNSQKFNTTGGDNSSYGYLSLFNNTSGNNNVANGNSSLLNNTTGNGNVGYGWRSLFSNTTGSNNTVIGNRAFENLNITVNDGTGNNTIIGASTGYGIVTGINNTIIGANVTGLPATLSNNIIIADGAGNQRINVDGNGNVGIGTTAPAASALLEITSTTKGGLMPRMTTAQKTAIATPATGLIVYDTDLNQLQVYNGSSWGATVTGTGTVTSASVVTANGVSGTVANPTTTPAITLTLGAITPSSVAATGALSGTQLNSTVTTGTAPLVVTSTTPVANLSIGGNAASATTATTATNFSGALTGDVSGTQGATAIGANKVTYAKMQNVTASRLLGNPTAGAAVPSEISVGSGLALSVGGVLTASGSGGTVTSASVTTANGVSGTVANPTTTPAITLTLGAITPTSVAATSTISGTQLTSTVATGTAPFVVTSTTPVTNLSIGGNAATATTASTVTTNANMNGDVTSVGNTTTIAANVVANADLNQVATATIKGRATAGTGNVEDLTATQVRTLLNVADATSVWKTTGNAGTTTGTNFIGTTDDKDVVFKRNGVQSGLLNSSNMNTSWGVGALNPATTGTLNIASGYNALSNNTTGTGNIATGYNALLNNTTGSFNVATGINALLYNIGGYSNVATGSSALSSNTTGNNNVAIGYVALNGNTIGQNNTATGSQALNLNTTGNNNIATGNSALSGNTTGSNNVATGFQALNSNTTGTQNTALGNSAGLGDGTTLQASLTDNNATFLGSQASRNLINTTTLTNITAIGYNAKVSQSNSLILGGTGADAVSVGIGNTAPNASAVLDVTSTTDGALLPRMTTVQKNAIATPATGLIVYDTNLNQLQVYNGSSWGATVTGTGTVTSASVVTANGVSGTVANPTTTPAITLTLGAITPSSVAATSTLSGTQLTSTVATGTAPLVVTSTTPVANLSIGGNAATATTATTATNFSGALTGDVSGTQGATAIGANKVTYAKMQTVTASRLLGNPTVSAAAPSEITVGSGLNLSTGGILTATGGTGSVTSASVTTANGVSGTVANPTTTPAITLTLGAITPTSVAATGALSGIQLTSTVVTGTAPLVVTSTTPVANLSIGGNAATATTASTVTTNANMNGDVTSVGNTTTIAANVVSNADLNQVATATIKGRATAGTGNVEDLTATQVRTLLNVADATSVWKTTGNAGTTAGTNFIGTTDDQDLVFKRNGVQSGLLGAQNISFGLSALNPATTGGYNVATGMYALKANTSGPGNTANGANALLSNTTGSYNSATGYNALSANTTGNYNTASGINALSSNTLGVGNTAIGTYVLGDNTTGNNNTALGYGAGHGDGVIAAQKTIVDNNALFLGYMATRDIVANTTSLSNITAIGYMAKVSQNNSMILGGTGANAVSVGIGNTAPDASAVLDVTSTTDGALLPRMTTVQRNAIASPATGLIVYDNTLNQLQVYNGTTWGATTSSTGWNLTGNAGTTAGTNFIGTTDDKDVVFKRNGIQSGLLNNALNNTSYGIQALNPATTGSGGNVAIGPSTLQLNTTGSQNVAIGPFALNMNLTGSFNVASGYNALQNTLSNDNVGIGNWALNSNTTGAYNTALGHHAGIGDNTSVQQSITDWGTTFLGAWASRDIVANSTTLSNITAIGYNAKVSKSNSLILGGTGANAVSVGIGNTAPDASAVLDITSTTKGGLLPRMTTAQKTAIATPATGLIVYDTDLNQLQVYNGTAWGTTASGGSGWSLTGNAGTTAGTNFIGTSDDNDVVFKRNGVQSGLLNGALYNTAFGVNALNPVATGTYNVAIGSQSLLANTTGNNNVAIGSNSLRANSTGYSNVAIGSAALQQNTTGLNNVATGSSALNVNTTGSDNTAIGYAALSSNTSGSSNVATGKFALILNTTGANNLAAGNTVLYSNTVGINNVATGNTSLYSNTNGSYNIGYGYGALYSNVTGSNSVAIGDHSQYYTNSTATPYTNSNVSVGYKSLQGSATASANTGNGNTALGYQTLMNNTTAIGNVALGFQALMNSTTGGSNNASGYNSLMNNTTGNSNVASGYTSLYSNTTGSGNIATGASSLYYNTTGNNNIATGVSSLFANTSGISNIATGFQTLNFNTNGSYNVALGYNAGSGDGTAEQKSTIDNYALFLGFQASRSLVANTTALNNITAIGKNAKVSQNNSIVLGGTGVDAVSVGIGNTAPDATAVLDITSTTKGGLMPRMTTAQKTAIATPANGLIVYDTDLNQLQVYNGTTWGATVSGWNLTGNAGTTAGINFIGTSDDKDVVFKRNGIQSGLLNIASFNTSWGVAALNPLATGWMNAAIGANALQANTSGQQNAATGSSALYSNTTGSYNVASGVTALYSNTTGGQNTALGTFAGYGDGSTAAQQSISDNGATFVGYRASRDIVANTTSLTNITAIGYMARVSQNNSMILGGTGANAVSVGIGNTAPAASAVLDITSTTKGSLMPRMTTAQKTAIATPATGLIVYDTDLNQLQVYNGASWGATTSGWGLAGNAGTTAGTNFIGTSDDKDVVFKRNGVQSGVLNNGLSNTSWGVGALKPTTTGSSNVALGYYTLNSNSSGNYNVGTGYATLQFNTTGSSNTATGNTALLTNTTGSNNVALGESALMSNTTGGTNVATGAQALKLNTSGAGNIATGYYALNANTTGNNNIAIGYNAGYGSGTSNQLSTIDNGAVFLGFQASRDVVANTTSLSNITAIGYMAKVSQNNSIILGGTGANAVSVGIGNTAPATSAVLDITSTTQGGLLPRMTTAQKTAIATPATGLIVYDTTLNQLQVYNGTAWGATTTSTGWNLTGNAGTTAGANFIGTSDDKDVVFKRNGIQSGLLNSQNYNTSWGVNALNPASSGLNNVAVGSEALKLNTSGGNNIALGYGALSANTTGNNNISSGMNSLFMNTSGFSNVGIGTSALYANTTGIRNTALGDAAGMGDGTANQKSITDNNATFVGYQASRDIVANTTALSNITAIGYMAKVSQNNSLILGGTGANKVSVGIGNTAPAASAVLDITSTTQGGLLPRMTQIQKAGIASPATGLIVFDTTLNQLQVYNGTVWAAASDAVREVSDEFTASAAQTAFALTQSPSTNSKVKMYINGIRISKTAYSNSGSILTYIPANNGSYALVVGDRIQMDYYY